MKKIVVIGAGVSGIIAAIKASQNEDEVIVLERNSEPLKKLLLTGSGKCNYYNENQDLSNYNSSDKEVLKKIITTQNLENAKNFWDSIGIVPKIKNGYYYPSTMLALSVKNALLKEVQVRGVKIITDAFVYNVEKVDNHFLVCFNDEKITCDSVIIAAGSKACPKTGSDGNVFDLIKKFKFNIIPVLPSLVQLRVNENFLKEWNGVRCDASLKLFSGVNYLKEEIGELQLTDYGISGICTFNISGLAAKKLASNQEVYVKINFLPFIKENIWEFLENFNEKVKNRTILELLENIINYKLVKIILRKSKISNDARLKSLTEKEKNLLYQNLTEFTLKIESTNSFDKAQVASGGVALSEINPQSFETMKVKNLYFTGEVLDVDGLCGGYNLTFACISGLVAGLSASNN